MYEGDLALTEADEVVVLVQGGDGWWEGELRGQRGRFPGNYVILLEMDSDNAAVSAQPEDEEPALGTEEVQEQEQEQEQEEEQQKEQQVGSNLSTAIVAPPPLVAVLLLAHRPSLHRTRAHHVLIMCSS